MKIGTSIIALLVCHTALTQNRTCGFDEQHARLNSENPGRAEMIHEQFVRITNGQISMMDRNDPIIIPVVVHVIHDGGESNISFEQIQSGIDMLNEDFNRLNADTSNTRNTATAPFEPYAANVGIQFELAKIDPDGNCTNGVERRYSPSVTFNAGDNAKHNSSGGLDAWPRQNYFNIWIVESIESSGSGITLGYAEFPYGGGSSNYGVIIRNDAYGNVGTASGNERTLTHEVGHCLGLLHTFQDGCHAADCGNNGDYCCDTPPESEAHWSCGVSQNSCTDVPTNDPYGFDALDQWENYMSYAPCQNMFSEDQKTIMLANLADISFLTNLVSLTNQTETGVGLPPQLCAAVFSSNTYVICAGQSVTFADESYFNVTGRTWNFSGGTPNSSTDQNPVITYNTPGIYDISLTVTDGVSNVTSIINDYLIVLANPGEGLPYHEGFENLTSFPDNQQFIVENDNNADAWQKITGVGYAGDHCLKLKNFGENDGTKDVFISGPIDLSSVDPSDDMIFNFQYAYVKRSVSNDEWLRFYISKDCGETWVLRKVLHGAQLSEVVSNIPYTPDHISDWIQVDVTNINSDYFVSNFRYKFEFENDNGNNIYIDHINLYPASMTDIETSEFGLNLSLYPNPAEESVTLQCEAAYTQHADLVVTNLLGEVIYSSANLSLNKGNNQIELNTADYASGIYLISFQTESGVCVLKFIKN